MTDCRLDHSHPFLLPSYYLPILLRLGIKYSISQPPLNVPGDVGRSTQEGPSFLKKE